MRANNILLCLWRIEVSVSLGPIFRTKGFFYLWTRDVTLEMIIVVLCQKQGWSCHSYHLCFCAHRFDQNKENVMKSLLSIFQNNTIDQFGKIQPQRAVIPTPLRIGFIGLGIMGQGMVMNLLRSGHKVTVWNRTAAKVSPLFSVCSFLFHFWQSSANWKGSLLYALSKKKMV